MRAASKSIALLPIATALALSVHAFTGEDHAVAGGHGAELGAALGLAALAWLLWLVSEAFRGRRHGARLGRVVANALPGDGHLGVLAAVVALEGALAFAGIEASEGRLVAALHLDPILVGTAFGLGGIGFACVSRLLAAWATRVGIALAESVDEQIVAIFRFRLATPRRIVLAAAVPRVQRGRAPPTISR